MTQLLAKATKCSKREFRTTSYDRQWYRSAFFGYLIVLHYACREFGFIVKIGVFSEKWRL